MTKTEQNRVLAWRLKVLREASAAPRERSLGLPPFWPITPSFLQVESPIRGSWRCWTVRSATRSAPFSAGHSA
jgi:hypothetical protein